MIKRAVSIMTALVLATVIFLLGTRMSSVQGRAKLGSGFAAVPDERGGRTLTGPTTLSRTGRNRFPNYLGKRIGLGEL